MATLRATMGVCPQHDVLYEELTAREHLNLYARFKAGGAAWRLLSSYQVKSNQFNHIT